MLDMVISERSHRVIRVVVIRLVSHVQTLLSGLLGRGLEVLR